MAEGAQALEPVGPAEAPKLDAARILPVLWAIPLYPQAKMRPVQSEEAVGENLAAAEPATPTPMGHPCEEGVVSTAPTPGGP